MENKLKNETKISGIYRIFLKLKNKEYSYIGISQDIFLRWNQHKRNLLWLISNKESFYKNIENETIPRNFTLYYKIISFLLENNLKFSDIKFEVLEYLIYTGMETIKELEYINKFNSFWTGFNGNQSFQSWFYSLDDKKELEAKKSKVILNKNILKINIKEVSFLNIFTLGVGAQTGDNPFLSRKNHSKLLKIIKTKFQSWKKELSIKDFNSINDLKSLNVEETKIDNINTNKNILETFRDLNKEQLSAVLTDKGALRIVAGPGSGKTKTLIEKIKYLMKFKNVNPNSILVITFTKKATAELKQRIDKELHIKLNNVYTFHGFAHKILREIIEDFSSFKILTFKDKEDFFQYLSNGDKEKIKDFKDYFKYAKIENYSEHFLKNSTYETNYYKSLVYKFLKFKKENKYYTFNDFFLLLEQKFNTKRGKEIFLKYKNIFKYIFIDEFQDTNLQQFNLIKNITDENSNITIVGDVDQNIYTWRGADISFIYSFNELYNNVKTIKLTRNYRSTTSIVNLANNIIKKNKIRIPLTLKAENKTNNSKVEFYKIFNRTNTKLAQYFISNIIKTSKDDFKDFAILARTNKVLKTYESYFIKEEIPYIVSKSTTELFELKYIQGIIYLLRFYAFRDDLDLLKLLERSVFTNSKYNTLTKLKIYLRDKYKQAYKSTTKNLLTILNEDNYNLIFFLKLNEFLKSDLNHINFMDNLYKFLIDTKYISKYKTKESDKFKDFLRRNKLDQKYNEKYNPFVEDYIKNILNPFNSFSEDFLQTNKNTDLKTLLKLYLSEVQINDDLSVKSKINAVSLLTIHSAKGTEFKNVFLLDPNDKKDILIKNSIEEEEEERRVWYVGITRAKERLMFIFNENVPSMYGYEPVEISKIIQPILKDLISQGVALGLDGDIVVDKRLCDI